jgi:hypothetical protein
MNTILVISFSNLLTDPRVNRQIRFLKDRYQIIAAGYGDPKIDNVDYIDLFPPRNKFIIPVVYRLLALPKKTLSATRLLIGSFDKYYWTKPEILHAYAQIKNVKCDLVLTNDIDTLPISVKLAQDKNLKIVFDAHEYAPREWEENLIFKIFFQRFKSYLCKKYISESDSMLTVCQAIADTYQKDTGIKPTVITNAPDYEDISPIKLSPNQKIQLVHHGGASASRRIDKMIKMMDYLDDRFELNLILIGGLPKYNAFLRKLAEENPNIKFLDPVPMREISQFLNQFDIGLYILEPSNFNNLYALPNKLFEFIQARLAIAIAPSPEMAKVVKEYDCGVVSEDFSPQLMAKSLMQLDIQKINYYKQRSHEAAHNLSAEKNKEILLRLVESVLQE